MMIPNNGFNYAVECLVIIIKYYRYPNTAYIIILMNHDTMVSICKASQWRSKVLFLHDITYFYLCYDIQKVLVLTHSVMQEVHLG
jgi:hypothetical protein